jgi:hypothetical protein
MAQYPLSNYIDYMLTVQDECIKCLQQQIAKFCMMPADDYVARFVVTGSMMDELAKARNKIANYCDYLSENLTDFEQHVVTGNPRVLEKMNKFADLSEMLLKFVDTACKGND